MKKMILRVLLVILVVLLRLPAGFCDSIGTVDNIATVARSGGALYAETLYFRNANASASPTLESTFTAVYNDSASTETLIVLPDRRIVLGPGRMALAQGKRTGEILDADQKEIRWNFHGSPYTPSLYAVLSPAIDRSFLVTTSFVAVHNRDGGTKPLPLHDPAAVLPESANQLEALSGIFLDGELAAQLSEKQMASLDVWVASGGILFLDSVSLKVLKGRSCLRGATVADDAQQQLDLAVWRKTAESLVPWAPTPVGRPGPNVGYGYGAYGGYSGYYGRASRKIIKPAPASAPSSRPASPTAFASISSLNIPADQTLQTIGTPPILAAWRYGEGIVSVQAFEGVGDETLMRNWVAVQLSRLYCPRDSLQRMLYLDVRLDLFSMDSDPRGILGEFERPLRAALSFPKLRRQWTILLALPIALLVLHLFIRFGRRWRWRHGLVALALVAVAVTAAAFAFPFGEALLIGRNETLSPLADANHEEHQLYVGTMRIGSTRPPENRLSLTQYPMWCTPGPFSYWPQPQITVSENGVVPISQPTMPPERLFVRRSWNNAFVSYAEKQSTGQVRLLVEKNTPVEFRGTLVNETALDLGDAFVILRVKDGWLYLNLPKTFPTNYRHTFSCIRGNPQQSIRNDKAVNCAFWTKGSAIAPSKFRTPFDRLQSPWRTFDWSCFPQPPGTGYILADLTDKLPDSPALTFQEKPDRELKPKYLIQLLACDGLAKAKPDPPPASAPAATP